MPGQLTIITLLGWLFRLCSDGPIKLVLAVRQGGCLMMEGSDRFVVLL